eukprot:c22996_g1_i1 orf=288-653(+)
MTSSILPEHLQILAVLKKRWKFISHLTSDYVFAILERQMCASSQQNLALSLVHNQLGQILSCPCINLDLLKACLYWARTLNHKKVGKLDTYITTKTKTNPKNHLPCLMKNTVLLMSTIGPV